MKFYEIVFFLLFHPVLLMAQNTGESVYPLRISVSGFEGKQGQLLLAVYNSEHTFLKEPFKGIIKDITAPVMEFTVELPRGTYAVSAYHDLNRNGQLDTRTIFKIPAEPYAFSNNAVVRTGPPPFREAMVKVPGTDSIALKVSYFKLK
ncbi:MAG: DUF2141 domain-containing protein [Bacteroidales bacterium]|nr:DUF2141 domain-containing protein [Bacteroidales bacterium]